MAVWTVRAAWTSSRPVVPDEHWSRIRLEAETEAEASLLAAQWVASRAGCEMPTRTIIEGVEL